MPLLSKQRLVGKNRIRRYNFLLLIFVTFLLIFVKKMTNFNNEMHFIKCIITIHYQKKIKHLFESKYFSFLSQNVTSSWNTSLYTISK